MQHMRISQIIEINILVTIIGNNVSKWKSGKIWSIEVLKHAWKNAWNSCERFFTYLSSNLCKAYLPMKYIFKIWFSGIKVNQVSHADINTDAQLQMWEILTGLFVKPE